MRLFTRILESLIRHPELLVVAFMVSITGALVVPLPPALLDLLLVANLGLSLTLLVSALHLRGPLALSTFPTLLLMATLFRLALNVSSTRLILGEGAAGKVIAAFGDFVVGGSYVVGAVVFVIVLIVQLIVVAKGAERVAEVGARFTLDALPGKQMAIDADLRAGTCTREEASCRRGELELESQFYGALDGAMKFVKGDAVAGLLITGINIVGGLAVGTAVHGLPMGEAAATFTLLSIGDGLVSQLPALLTAVAAGLVVTRVGSGGRLGAEVVSQLASQPRSIIASGAVLALLGLVPGLPALPFVALGAAATGAGFLSARRINKESVDDSERRAEADTGPDEVPEFGPIIIVLDAGVAQSVFEELSKESIPKLRARLASELGLPLPPIPVIRSPRPGRGFEMILNDLPAIRGQVPEGDTLQPPTSRPSLFSSRQSPASAEAPAISAAIPDRGDQEPATMISRQATEHPGNSDLSIDTPQDLITREIETILRQRAGELLSLDTVQELLDLLEKRAPALVREASGRLPVTMLFEILVRLLDEQVSIRPLDRILEALVRRGEAREGLSSAAALTEHARQALGRYLVHERSNGRGLAAVLLDPLVEDLLRQSRTDTVDGPVLALLPEHQSGLISAMKKELHGGAVLLAPADLRRQLWALARSAVPAPTVLAYQELPIDSRVQPVSRLAIEGLDPLMLVGTA